MSGSRAFSRRGALRAIAATAGASLLDIAPGLAATLLDPGPVLDRLIASHAGQAPACEAESALGSLLGTLPLSRPDGVDQPFAVKIGGPGLDARSNTDLSRLQPGRLITPTDQVYVRTECPLAVAAHEGPWAIAASGLVEQPSAVSLDDLSRDARPMGAHLLECSGNNNPANFGLMSVSEWDGVPLADVVRRLRPPASATAVLVSGKDPDQPSRTSVAGASWVLPLSSLDSLGAFLAVRMNGAALTPDHGRPVRLAVPGWYGCSWIKWVDEIRLVDASEPATSQMREFASRTHQTALHDLAAAYAPPVIQTAATPVRVEKRRGASGLDYRIVGIVWGGSRPVSRLAIRFGTAEQWQPFDVCPAPAPASASIWSLWTFQWKPAAPGLYSIYLQVPDTTVPQRRLDSGYYVRQVKIEEV